MWVDLFSTQTAQDPEGACAARWDSHTSLDVWEDVQDVKWKHTFIHSAYLGQALQPGSPFEPYE